MTDYRKRREELADYVHKVYAINPHKVPKDKLADYLLARFNADRVRKQIAALDREMENENEC